MSISQHAKLIFPLLLLVANSAFSEDQIAAPRERSDAVRKESAARLNLMRRKALSLTVEVETTVANVAKTEVAEILETPLLRYSNQAAQIITSDATVWAWGRTGRPAALASVDETGFEIASLSDDPVSLTAKSGLKWSPKASEISWKIVPDAPRPSDSLTARARQMKEISKRFTAKGYYGAESGTYELRLLERQLYRYSNPKAGLVDGALYAYAAGTNPEVILLIECRQSEEKRLEWFYGFTRLSAGSLEARLGEKVVWSCPGVLTWNATDPYWSPRFGEADIVPENNLPTIEPQ